MADEPRPTEVAHFLVSSSLRTGLAGVVKISRRHPTTRLRHGVIAGLCAVSSCPAPPSRKVLNPASEQGGLIPPTATSTEAVDSCGTELANDRFWNSMSRFPWRIHQEPDRHRWGVELELEVRAQNDLLVWCLGLFGSAWVPGADSQRATWRLSERLLGSGIAPLLTAGDGGQRWPSPWSRGWSWRCWRRVFGATAVSVPSSRTRTRSASTYERLETPASFPSCSH